MGNHQELGKSLKFFLHLSGDGKAAQCHFPPERQCQGFIYHFANIEHGPGGGVGVGGWGQQSSCPFSPHSLDLISKPGASRTLKNI